jgi:hypothetical protein
VTFLIVHDEDPGSFSVRFEYLILPAYVTDRFKGSESLRAPLDGASDGEVKAFVESGIKSFLLAYLKARTV